MTYSEIIDLLQVINANRREGGSCALRDERDVEQAFEASCKLAIYGSLAPGASNHHIVNPIHDQEWLETTVEGRVFELGWGIDMGYPAMVWTPGQNKLSTHLLKSPDLPNHWSRLDFFEGDNYIRILIPVFLGASFLTVANIYEARWATDAIRDT